MADIFLSQDAQNLLRGKIVYLFGDSNIRALYKDIVCLLVENKLISKSGLRNRAESSFLGDRLVYGTELSKGRGYKEHRLYKEHNLHVEFNFITRCYNDDIEKMMYKVRDGRSKAPDVIIMNSSLWDVSRWGSNGVQLFKDNLLRLLKLFKSCLPSSTLVMWVTVPPIAGQMYGGFLIKQVEFMKYTMRFEMMEANLFAHQEVGSAGYDVLDFHYHLRMLIHQRLPDGVHWNSKAMRHLTNLVLTHICLAWNIPLPGNFQSKILDRYKDPDFKGPQGTDIEFPVLPTALDMLPPPPPNGRSTSRNHPIRLDRTVRRRRPEVRLPERTPEPFLPTPTVLHQNLQVPCQAPQMAQYDYAPLPPSYQQPAQVPDWSDNNYGTLYQSFETDPQPNYYQGPVRNRTSYNNRYNPY